MEYHLVIRGDGTPYRKINVLARCPSLRNCVLDSGRRGGRRHGFGAIAEVAPRKDIFDLVEPRDGRVHSFLYGHHVRGGRIPLWRF